MAQWSKLHWGEKETGANLTDRAKSGTKRSVLTDGHGVPIGVAIAGANRHDMKLTEVTLKTQRISPPDLEPGEVRHICLDKGFV
jgi:hypothetical protein